MLIPTTMVDMDWEDTMVDTEAMVLVWDTGPMVLAMVDMVDSMASVRLKLSPRLMLIPTTMVDMDWEDTMVDTEAMVLVWDTGPMVLAMVDMVDSMASVRLTLSPRPMLIPTIMVDMDMVDMVDTGATVLDWDTGAMVLVMAGAMAMAGAVKSDL